MSTMYLCALCGEAPNPETGRVVWTFPRGSICNECFHVCAIELQKRQTRIVVSPSAQQTPPPPATQSPTRRMDYNSAERTTETILRGIAMNRTPETIIHLTDKNVCVLSKRSGSEEWDVSSLIGRDLFEPILQELRRLANLPANNKDDKVGLIEITALTGHARYQFRAMFRTDELYGLHVIIYF